MSHYHGLYLPDVVFTMPPHHVLALVEGLPDTSLYAAYLAGGDKWREFHGWGKDRHMSADFYDLYSAAHTPQGKKAFAYPRPSSKPQPGQGTPLMQMFPRMRPGGV